MQSQGKAAHDVIALYFVELVEERIMSESNRLNVLEYLLQDRAWLLCIPPITAPCGQFRQHQGLVPANEQTGISNFMSVSITTTTSNGGGLPSSRLRHRHHHRLELLMIPIAAVPYH